MIWLCLALALALVAIGLLAVFRAPTFPLFFVAVGATELGHLFALAAVLLAVVVPKETAVGLVAAALALIAAGLLISPLVRAYLGAAQLRKAFEAGLGVRLRRPIFQFFSFWIPAISHRQPSERIVIDGVGGKLAIDFFQAKDCPSAALVVIVHGGGWMAGGPDELSGWNAWLTARGYAVAAVDYRLVPTGVWPAQGEDVLAGVEHLRADAARLGIDPERVILIGRSAGGQIAGALAAPGKHRWLRGCVCFYSPFDMVFAYEHGREEDMLRSRWLLRCFLGGTPEREPEIYQSASAYLTVQKEAPPFLLFHGGRDELVWIAQSVRFSQKLAELGVRHAFLKLPWATHAFDYNMTGPGGQLAGACLESFLAQVCSSENI